MYIFRPVGKIWNWTRRNTSHIINLLMVAGTLLLFWKASEQSKAAFDAVKYSDSSYQFYLKSFESSNEDNAIRFKRDSINTQKRFKLDSSNAQNQIGALNEAVKNLKKQFDAENTPYLIINKIDSIGLLPNELLYFEYKIINIGRLPVRLVGVRQYFTIDKTDNITIERLEKEINKTKIDDAVGYIGNQHPHEINSTTDNAVTYDSYLSVNSGNKNLYWIAEYFYVNLPNESQKRRFEIIGEIFIKNGKSKAYILKIKNEDSPNPK